MEGGTHAVQRSGRIDSGKALAVARKFSKGKLASKALTGANFLPLSSSFLKFDDNSDWRNDTAAQRAFRCEQQYHTASPISLSLELPRIHAPILAKHLGEVTDIAVPDQPGGVVYLETVLQQRFSPLHFAFEHICGEDDPHFLLE
ncbi:hypothetical protein SAMN04488688_109140 [Paenibacillus sp. cl141a]|nr:hypothetical protein SAMN04488688_109140 [Paenibacillus sp. cl141a]